MKRIIVLILAILFMAVSADAQVYLWRYSTHATDCTGLTGGKARDLCFEVDDQRLYKCVPSAGDCDTAGEWKAVEGGGATTLQGAFDGGQTITVANTDNQTFAFTQSDTTNNPNGITVNNDGTGDAIYVQQDGNGKGFNMTNNGTQYGMYISQQGVLAASRYALVVESGGVQVNANAAVARFRGNGNGSTQPVVEVVQDNVNSTGTPLDIQQDGDATHINLNGDPTNSTPVDGDLWFTGAALNFYDGSGTTDILANTVDVTLAGTPNYLTLSGQAITLTKLDISDDTNMTAGRSLTLTANDVAADAELYTDSWSIVLETPADADAFLFVKAQSALTITDVDCITSGGTSAVIDVQECSGTGTGCTTIDATIICDSDGAADDGSLTNGAIDSGDWMNLDIGTVTGSVDYVTVTVKYTLDD